MVLRFFLFAVLFLFLSCTDFERDNQYDLGGVNYIGNRVSYGSVTYEGETYKTVVIGTQTWLAENLNYNASSSKCYDNDPANCVIYGRLYDWATAMALPDSCNSSSCASQISAQHRGICPNGWHIPSKAEWTTLTDFVGDQAGRYLKAANGWRKGGYGSGNGEDKFGFSALPGGTGNQFEYGSFNFVGYDGNWWIPKEDDEQNCHYYDRDNNHYRCIDVLAYCISMDGGASGRRDYANENKNFKTNLLSVRCLQD